MQENEDQVDFLDDIYETAAPTHTHAAFAEFKPWHHPRKHWVRINQLCTLTQKLMKESSFNDGNVLRYLTLPGEDLLDIDSIENAATSGAEELLDLQAVAGVGKQALKVKYLGFNTVGKNRDRAARQNTAESALKDRDTIDSSSKIVNYEIQSIANENSLAYREVSEFGPFNVINLDLCKSVASPPKNSNGHSYFDAISTILELQRQNMAQPFLLLITTRTAHKAIDKEALEKIVAVYKDNFAKSEEFKKELEALIHSEAEALLKKLTSGETVPQEFLNRIFGVGLGKWLLHLVKNGSPEWNVSIESMCCYGIGQESGTMLSIAFKFTRVNVSLEDKFGLSSKKRKAPSDPQKTETMLAIEMLSASKTIVDVDFELESNPESKKKVVGQAGALLERIGYERSKYDSWAMSQTNASAKQ